MQGVQGYVTRLQCQASVPRNTAHQGLPLHNQGGHSCQPPQEPRCSLSTDLLPESGCWGGLKNGFISVKLSSQDQSTRKDIYAHKQAREILSCVHTRHSVSCDSHKTRRHFQRLQRSPNADGTLSAPPSVSVTPPLSTARPIPRDQVSWRASSWGQPWDEVQAPSTTALRGSRDSVYENKGTRDFHA